MSDWFVKYNTELDSLIEHEERMAGVPLENNELKLFSMEEIEDSEEEEIILPLAD